MCHDPAPAQILIIEDEAKTASTLALYLRHAGYGVRIADDGAAGLALARGGGFDLVLLDLMLPGLDGREVCQALRASSQVPIIMLTARTQEEERIAGLELGADDYVSKPFSPREVVARVRAVLRRAPTPHETGATPPLCAGPLVIDLERHEARLEGRPLALTATELHLLATLAAAPQRVFSRATLIERVCGHDFEGLERTIDAHVKNLRRKLAPHGNVLIVTVFGVGYKLVPETLADASPDGGGR